MLLSAGLYSAVKNFTPVENCGKEFRFLGLWKALLVLKTFTHGSDRKESGPFDATMSGQVIMLIKRVVQMEA